VPLFLRELFLAKQALPLFAIPAALLALSKPALLTVDL
jgi:hypothetical protein